jgi:hypothetical protein
MKRKLILRNFLSPGDLVMLTAAVRDLHRCHPGRFQTDVRTSCPELWEHNPHLTSLHETDRDVEQIDCHYPLIDRSNEAPYHCIHGFTEFLSGKLELNLRPTFFGGDIHLSRDERRWKSTVHELAGVDLPFWIVNAGGKFDFTIKWWDWRRYQKVIDHFRGKILFVQVGEIGHYHPALRNVVDLRGKTDLRQLVRLTYHAQGVLCGITALMHLAAAVPVRPDRPPSRAAVIIAGGREPTHWEAYPHHQFLHTIGALPCCLMGGCWRARTRALGDGEETDEPKNLCTDVTGELPRCMDMITAEQVIERIEFYFAGGANRYLAPRQLEFARRAVARSLEGVRFDSTIHLGTVSAELEQAASKALREKLPPMNGRAVILFATNRHEVIEALACARVIRALKIRLPVECWASLPFLPRTAALFGDLNVNVIDCSPKDGDALPMTQTELRAHALDRTKYQEVLVLAPGAFPLAALDLLFANRAYKKSGVLFFHQQINRGRRGVWKLCGLKFPRKAVSATHFVVDRARCWSALALWRWVGERKYFFHGYVDRDGGEAQFAFAKLRQSISIAQSPNAFWADEACAIPALVRRHRAAAARALH